MAVRISDTRSRGLSPLESHIPAFKINEENGKVIVVGAGAAGLYAATLLAEEGFEVIILEASERHGGRIRHLDGFADFPVEIGAEEIHGEESIYYEIAVEDCKAETVKAKTQDLYWISGMLLNEEVAKENEHLEQAMELIDGIEDYEGRDISLADYFKEQGIDKSIWHIINAEVANEHGTSAERIGMSGLAFEENHWEAGKQNFMLKNRTHLSILEQCCESILKNIQYKKIVTSIDYSEEYLTVATKDGQSYQADAVIVTVPLTMLKATLINFYPALPKEKQHAIQKIGMDAGLKIILKFKERFWDADLGSIFGELVPEYWATSVGRSDKSHLITAFVNGVNAEYLSHEGEKAIEYILNELDKIFGGNLASQHYEKAYIMDWFKEPFIKGAYSYDKVGIGNSRQVLAQAVDGKIFFAGEATCTNGHHASIHGAMESAERAVEELLEVWEG